MRRAPFVAVLSAAQQMRETVAALDETEAVEIVETHMSLVFLTDRHAYKLKKPIRTAVLDYSTVEARRRACEAELELNRRLAADVYLDVVPVAGAGGETIDWLVKMRRLPRDRMLDACIERGDVAPADIDRVAAVLDAFYASARRWPSTGPEYRARIAADIESKRDSLARPRYELRLADIDAVVAAQRRWLADHGALLESRGAHLVDAHGDLRPEHVCLEGPRVIDCIEFHPALRRLDPISELSFLGLECRRLGAPWIGERLLAGRRGQAALVPFYQSTHALVRAAVAVWHLDDDALERSDCWRARAGWYLRVARELL